MDKLPIREFYTIVAGGVALSANAGYINVVSMAGVFPGVTVSHVTGSVSRIAISIFQGDFDTFALVLSIVISFMFGSFVSGLIVGDSRFKLGQSYAYTLFIESAALFFSYIFLRQELILGEWLAAFACGLQNAMVTSYSGMVIRTTHMTGMVTDIGNILGQACRADGKPDLWRLRVHFPLLGGFLLGGFLGQAGWILFRERSLIVPAVFVGGIGAVYLTTPFIRDAAAQLKQEQDKLKDKLNTAFAGMQIRFPPMNAGSLGFRNFYGAPGTPAPEGGTATSPETAKALANDLYAAIKDRNVDQDIETFMSELIRVHQEQQVTSATGSVSFSSMSPSQTFHQGQDPSSSISDKKMTSISDTNRTSTPIHFAPVILKSNKTQQARETISLVAEPVEDTSEATHQSQSFVDPLHDPINPFTADYNVLPQSNSPQSSFISPETGSSTREKSAVTWDFVSGDSPEKQ